jgi:hypothetical protein
MADNDQVVNEAELHDENVMEEAHDPKNAEVDSVASVAKAADAGPSQSGTRKGDVRKSDPMPKTKAGMISAMYNKMSGMKKAELNATFGKYMGEEVEVEETEVSDTPAIEDSIVEFNYSDELSALVESEGTLSEEFKAKTAVIFEAAVKVKLSEEIDRLEAQYAEELAEEVGATKSELVEKVDSYLNYVVDQWMEDNAVAVQTGLRTEIAEGFMSKLKDVFVESYIEVPESKVDLVDDLAEQVEELEASLNATTERAIHIAEELETYKRDAIIAEATRGLAITQAEKLAELAENIEFDNVEIFTTKVATLKETYFKAEKVESSIIEDTDQDVQDEVSVSAQMSSYINAIKKSSK